MAQVPAPSRRSDFDISIERCWFHYVVPLVPLPETSADRRWLLSASLANFLTQAGPRGGYHLISDVDWERVDDTIHFNYEDFRACYPYQDFPSMLRENFSEFMQCMGMALYHVRRISLPGDAPESFPRGRFLDVTPYDSFEGLMSSRVGKLVSVKGVVTRVAPPKPIIVRMTWMCQKCNASTTFDLPDGKVTYPRACGDPGCRSFKFLPDREGEFITAMWQQFRLQEGHSMTSVAGGKDKAGPRVPQSIDVEVRGDLLDKVNTGETVVITGLLRSIELDIAAGGGTRDNARMFHVRFIEAHSIVNQAGGTGVSEISEIPRGIKSVDDLAAQLKSYSKKDLDLFLRITNHKDTLALIIASLCPRIVGHETVKLALLLGLFGGARRTHRRHADVKTLRDAADGGAGSDAMGLDDSMLGTQARPAAGGSGGLAQPRGRSTMKLRQERGDAHILIVGDPGMGKSALLRAVSNLAPRGVYVSGQTTTARGLTVTVIPDRDEHVVEAGAMVLSDNGICSIDEFDKMAPENAANLLEAMEQQRISIAKGGTVYSLSCRTAVLAAANPASGHYDRSKSITENLRLSPALLSRFDLVHLLLDTPERSCDADLVGSIVARSTATGRQSAIATGPGAGTGAGMHSQAGAGASFGFAGAAAAFGGGAGMPGLEADGSTAFVARLRERVRAIPPADYLPEGLLRKYVAFARRFCQPGLSLSAYRVLQDFFTELRSSHAQEDTVPMTTRQLESLVRLTQARAKLCLARTAEASHCEDVVGLWRCSLFDAAMDDFGSIDFGKAAGSHGLSQAKVVTAVADRLGGLVRQGHSPVFTREELLDIIGRVPTKPGTTALDVIERMNTAGYLILQAGGGKAYKFLAT